MKDYVPGYHRNPNDHIEICVIGTGASGWMACNYLKRLPWVKKITVIGSSQIPSIGVGESTTGRFTDFLSLIDSSASEFIRESDASVKYGVMYEGWSPRPFLHALRSETAYARLGWDQENYARLLGKKPRDHWLHDYIDGECYKFATENMVSRDADLIEPTMRCLWDSAVPRPLMPEYTNSFHFEANKFIAYMKKVAERSDKVEIIDGEVTDAVYDGEDIKEILLKDGRRISADYYVISTGETSFNERVFRAEYHSLGDVLLTDRAVFYPWEYQDKRQQIHPYTVAKTMRHGWRWITPTYSRIGTGYVFSSNHATEGEIIDEFRRDLDDPTVEPRMVDFKPRAVINPFRWNHCFLGMAAGFLEPLDAPGLDITVNFLHQIDVHLNRTEDERRRDFIGNDINARAYKKFMWFSAFILSQYKTSHRNDSQFWEDQKAVECSWYDEIMENIHDISKTHVSHQMMFYSTMAGKDLKWFSGYDLKKQPLFPVDNRPTALEHHLDWLERMRTHDH
jgi:tryptophan halogenase